MDDEYNRLHADDPCSISKLQLRAHVDREKGIAVKRQKLYWEHWLGLRILLQKSLSIVNRSDFLSATEAAEGVGSNISDV